MTLYLLIGLSWTLVGLALLFLRLLDERDPARQWRFLFGAAAAPFVVVPLAGGCAALMARAVSLVPLLGSPWPLALLAGGGVLVAAGRAWLVGRRERAILAACRLPEGARAAAARARLRPLSRAAGLARVPRLLVYPRGAYACALGVRRPTIVVSEALLRGLDDEEIEGILAHEVAHVRRQDYARNWLALLVRAALFFLPAGILSGRLLAEVRERRADDLAVRYTGKPLALAAALVAVWQRGATSLGTAPAPLLGSAGSLEARICRLLDPGPAAPARWRASLGASLLAASVLLVLTALDGGAHALARLGPPTVGDGAVSPAAHCVAPRLVFSSAVTIACSRVPPWTS